MSQYVWDPERMCYFPRGLGFYANFALMIFIGVFSVIMLILFIQYHGLVVLLLLIFWIPVYLSLWSFFSADWRWPRKNLEVMKREAEAERKQMEELFLMTTKKWKEVTRK